MRQHSDKSQPQPIRIPSFLTAQQLLFTHINSHKDYQVQRVEQVCHNNIDEKIGINNQAYPSIKQQFQQTQQTKKTQQTQQPKQTNSTKKTQQTKQTQQTQQNKSIEKNHQSTYQPFQQLFTPLNRPPWQSLTKISEYIQSVYIAIQSGNVQAFGGYYKQYQIWGQQQRGQEGNKSVQDNRKMNRQLLPLDSSTQTAKKPLLRYILVGPKATIHRTAILTDHIIIGTQSTLLPHSYIRPNVVMGQKCTIGSSCEVKNTIMMNHVTVAHLNYVGDAVLGTKVHLGAGVVLSNLRLDQSIIKLKIRTLLGQNGNLLAQNSNPLVKTSDQNTSLQQYSYIDTNLRKFSCIIGSNTQIGAKVVVNPGTIIARNVWVYPGIVVGPGFIEKSSIVKQKWGQMQVVKKKSKNQREREGIF